jgi:hypothetical protein
VLIALYDMSFGCLLLVLQVLSLLTGGVMGSGLPAMLYKQQSQQHSLSHSNEHMGQLQHSQCYQQQDPEDNVKQHQQLHGADVRYSMLQQLGVELMADFSQQGMQQDMQLQLQHAVDGVGQAAGPAISVFKYILRPLSQRTVTGDCQSKIAGGGAAGQAEKHWQQGQHEAAEQQQQQQQGPVFSSIQAAVMAISMLQWQLCHHQQQHMPSEASLKHIGLCNEQCGVATATIAQGGGLVKCCCDDRLCASASCSGCSRLHAKADKLVRQYLMAGAGDLQHCVPRWLAAEALIM